MKILDLLSRLQETKIEVYFYKHLIVEDIEASKEHIGVFIGTTKEVKSMLSQRKSNELAKMASEFNNVFYIGLVKNSEALRINVLL